MENIDCEFKRNPTEPGHTRGNIIRSFYGHLKNLRTIFEDNEGTYGSVLRMRGPGATVINIGSIFR